MAFNDNNSDEPMLLDFDAVVRKLGSNDDDSDNMSTGCESTGGFSMLSGISISDQSLELLKNDGDLLEPIPCEIEPNQKIQGLLDVNDAKISNILGDGADSQHHHLIVDRLKVRQFKGVAPCHSMRPIHPRKIQHT